MLPLRVLLQPIETDDWDLLTAVAIQIPKHLPFVHCQVASEPVPLPPSAVTLRRQWLANVVLAHLLVPNGYDRVIGVTGVDLVVPPLNFVFGLAEMNGKRAVISTARLKHHSSEVMVLRTLKEVLHELGHTLGLPHCPNPTCVAAFSNSLADTDQKGPGFCFPCYLKLAEAWRQLRTKRR